MSAQDLAITSLFDVKGKIVLVTGGGVGIGKMIATGFAKNGATVYIAARKEPQLKEAVEDIRKVATGKINYIVANVGSKAGCDALIAEFKRRETTLHVLVNNSGITWGGPYNDFPEEKGWDNVFNVNVKSVFYMTAGLSDYLAKDSTSHDPGRVVNISSTASVNPFSEGELSAAGNGTWSYQPSKAAVNHLTSALAVKLAPKFVTVNAILPGVYPSKMTAFGFKTSGDKMVASQPMGRVGAPSDMAGLALFLASPAAAHITGAHIITDGGARLFSQAKL
ncbi:rhamnolipids biosynthesis 3-oxoacyl-reductase [Mycena albidolilacea]|uniref:Rhamnolipids biosynthesis 3-oxoacyl-reductase n=1 Tax=Mycena albidolilacea TaxID=1033008 RepID=A0AAD7A4G5_9AGAR|nr:rhamnolipids biosynthesis 3-oxoacyl-reductase [Mycena albidolilacea]